MIYAIPGKTFHPGQLLSILPGLTGQFRLELDTPGPPLYTLAGIAAFRPWTAESRFHPGENEV